MLLEYLSRHADEPVSAEQIAAAIDDSAISISAVYRNLAALEKTDKIQRITKQGSRKVFYRYMGAEHCADRIHLSCKKCGKMYHMDMEATDQLISGVAEKNRFAIDKADTVLVGICADCQGSMSEYTATGAGAR